jgi:hypothetical protein
MIPPGSRFQPANHGAQPKIISFVVLGDSTLNVRQRPLPCIPHQQFLDFRPPSNGDKDESLHRSPAGSNSPRRKAKFGTYNPAPNCYVPQDKAGSWIKVLLFVKSFRKSRSAEQTRSLIPAL